VPIARAEAARCQERPTWMKRDFARSMSYAWDDIVSRNFSL